jgi:hypothetical protein
MLIFPTTKKSAKASLYRSVNMPAHNYRREGKETLTQTDSLVNMSALEDGRGEKEALAQTYGFYIRNRKYICSRGEG